MAVKKRGSSYDRLFLSSELYGTFDRYIWSLRKQILDDAAARAVAREGHQHDIHVSANDIALAAEKAFSEAAPGLDKALSRRETKHVRRAS
jgi:hypothetical protein